MRRSGQKKPALLAGGARPIMQLYIRGGIPVFRTKPFGARGLVPLPERKAPLKRGKNYPGRKIKMKPLPPTCKSRLF